jgi:hypothetical protein
MHPNIQPDFDSKTAVDGMFISIAMIPRQKYMAADN